MDEHVGKTVPITQEQVAIAYRKVRQGGKGTGIDYVSWEEFDKKLDENLYMIWNRLSSGSYHAQAVREVEIPKKDGTVRKLGIPTLRDRVAQQVVKVYMEEKMEPLFHENSYGYRPLKSGHDALEQVRQNCHKLDWVLDLDISKFFDEIDHEIMLKAVEHVFKEKWVKMYVLRWLEAPTLKADGTLQPKEGKGTPQGGVISPLLANIYLHYTLDKWLNKYYPKVSFVRYADDIIIHCTSKEQAEEMLIAVEKRLLEVNLRLNRTKTQIAYCKDYRRRGEHERVKFDFLGFSFQPRPRKGQRDGRMFIAFAAEINQAKMKEIREVIRNSISQRNTLLEITQIARTLNPKLRGWINYFGIYSMNRLVKVTLRVDQRLIRWLSHKHKINLKKSFLMLKRIKQEYPNLFYHWKIGAE